MISSIYYAVLGIVLICFNSILHFCIRVNETCESAITGRVVREWPMSGHVGINKVKVIPLAIKIIMSIKYLFARISGVYKVYPEIFILASLNISIL